MVRSASDALPAPEGYTHARVIADTESLLERNYEALALFLTYPTRRLAGMLRRAAADACAAVVWLAQNPLVEAGPSEAATEYAACCERLQSGIADWRLSVDLKWATHDLEYVAPEILH